MIKKLQNNSLWKFKMGDLKYWVLIQNDILLVIKNVLFFVEANTL